MYKYLIIGILIVTMGVLLSVDSYSIFGPGMYFILLGSIFIYLSYKKRYKH